MKKFRIFGLLCMALALCAILMVTTTEAAAETSGFYTYTVSDGNATITKCSAAISGDVAIPVMLDGYPVTAIGEKAFYSCHNLTAVTIPQNVTSIGYAAFSDCTNLKTVTILNGVTKIEGSAFSWCVNLKSVIIPASITNIGHYAFYYCPALKNVTYCGTAEKWGKITIGSVNDALKSATRTYHNWEDATCGTPKTCSLCGLAEGEATGLHTYGQWIETLAPTCTKEGSKTQTCTVCGHEETEKVAMLAHVYGETVTAPTCTEKGFTTHTCACGDSYVDTYVDALGHDHKATVTAPTCTEKGFTTHTCACGDSYVDTYVEATGHTLSTWTTVKAATCTTDGSEKRSCACGETETRVIPALGHSGEQWFVAISPTCTTTGLKARICSTCGETETAEIPALGHDYLEEVTKPTCTEKGFTVYTCTVCGHSYEGAYVSATGHSWSDWVVNITPSCTTPGEKTRICACGAEDKQSVDALGHTWSDWAVTTEPTCTADGEETRTCACGATETKPIAAKGHSWSNWEVVTEATCTADGEEARTCACGATETKPIAAKGHSWSNWEVVTKSTCTAEGEEKRTCACGETETQAIPVLPHGWSSWVQLEAPTCSTEGTKWHFCNCGATEYAPIETLPHKYADGVCVDCGALNPELFYIDVSRMILGNSLEFQFGVAKSNFTDLTGIYAVVEKSWANGTITTQTIPATQWGEAGQYYAIVYNGLAAKEMADSFKVTIYSAAGNPLSYPKTDSVRDYVMRSIDGQTAKGRTMLVDMLGYGAAAQQYFGYNTADLANNKLTDTQKAWGTATAAATTDTRNVGANYFGTRLVLQSSIQMQVAFTGLDETMYAVYSYTDYTGKTQSVTVKGEDFIQVNGMYGVELNKLVYADARQAVTVQIFSADGTLLSIVTDSIESYVNRSGADTPLYDALIKFADSAKVYLTK